MRTRLAALPVLVLLAATASPAPVPKTSDPPKPVLKTTFAVAPITTDLQRRLVGRTSPKAKAVVFVDGANLFPEPDRLDVTAIDLAGIRTALAEFGPSADSTVHFTALYRNDPPTPRTAEVELIDCALEGVGRKAGFGQASAQQTYHSLKWDDFVKPLTEEGKGDEKPVGDERAKAYPVRTPLSRALARDVDAVIDVIPPLDGRAANLLPADVEESIDDAIKKLGVEKGKKVNIAFNIRERDDKTQARVRTAAKRVTERHGLELNSYSY